MPFVRLLGPTQLLHDGTPINLGPTKQRLVFAVLAVDAGQPVGTETLIDRVWGDAPPAAARSAVYSYVTRLRHLLDQFAGAGARPALVRRPVGYVLDIETGRVDLHRFRALVDEARHATDDVRSAAALDQALRLWQGLAMSDLTGPWATGQRQLLEHERLDVVLRWAELELRLDRPAATIGRLRQTQAQHPLAEPIAVRLVEALYRAGRAAEALACYASTRRELVEELGAEPGPELQAVHRRVLRGETIPAGPPDPPSTRSPVPAQLPPDLGAFSGRTAYLKRLDALLDAGSTAVAVTIAVLTGTAGVGKTTLATHWSHRVRDRFPDGQLYVDLRGYDPSAPALHPDEAIRGFLDALRVPPERVPATPEARVGLFRSLLDGKRMLVLLDNAREADQVRPLLPGASGCLALVTGRDQLTGLVAGGGASLLGLDLLSTIEAWDLLAGRLGQERLAAEPDAVDELIARCARLPLALAIVAARAVVNPTFGMAVLAAELREAAGSLDGFAGSDAGTDVRVVFSWSYRTLGPSAARLFRLLWLHPGLDTSVPAAASLAGVPIAEIRPLLAELIRAHLLAEPTPGRIDYHDLLRAYAGELVSTVDSDAERQAARQRILDHYRSSAYAAALLLSPGRESADADPPGPGVTPEQVSDHLGALRWFATEYRGLLAAVQQSGEHGLTRHGWELAQSLVAFQDRQGHWADLATTQAVAVAAALQLDDRSAQAQAHRSLARAHARLGRFEDAHAELHRALGLYTLLGDSAGQAHTHLGLSWLLERQSRYHRALIHARRAFGLYRVADHPMGQARALNAIGWYHALLGNFQQTFAYCERALKLNGEAGNRSLDASIWDSLGYAHLHLGQYHEAIGCYRRAVEEYRALGHRYEVAYALRNLGDAQAVTGDCDAARRSWQQALDILDALGHPDADRVREKLGATVTSANPTG